MNGGNNKKERGEPPIFFPNLLGSRTDGSKIFVGNTFCLIGGRIVIVVGGHILLYVVLWHLIGDLLNHILYYFNPSSDYFANNVSIAAVKMYAMAKPYAM